MRVSLKDPSTQKIFAVCLIGILVIYLFITQVYTRNSESIRTLNDEYQMLNTNYIYARRSAMSLPALQMENEKLSEEWEALKNILPEEEELPDLIDEVSKAGHISNLIFTSFVPQPVKHHPFYNENSFKLQVVGRYHDIGRLFCELGNMERIVKVSDLKIGPIKKSSFPDRTVEVDCTLRTYVLKKGGEKAGDNED
jgi:type IV pilus assembly protein PilO